MSTASFVQSDDGLSIAYESCGRGPTLVFVHGLGDDRTIWSSVCARLADRFECVTLDLRGHGSSATRGDFDLFGLARDVTAVLRALALDAPPVLVGHSLGGFVATVCASNAKVGAVVNLDQPLSLGAFAGVLASLRDALQHGVVAEVLMDVLRGIGLGPLSPGDVMRLQKTRERLARETLLGIWGPLLGENVAALNARIDDILSRVMCPYVSLHTSSPPTTYRAWLEARIPRAQVVHWPGLGHFPQLAAPKRLADFLADFAAGLNG